MLNHDYAHIPLRDRNLLVTLQSTHSGVSVPLLPRAPRGRGDVLLHTNTPGRYTSSFAVAQRFTPRLDDQGNATAVRDTRR